MPSYFSLRLDTTAPSGLTLAINGGALYTTQQAVTLAIGLTDGDTTGYQMKIWGIDSVSTETAATWETYATSKSVTLPATDGQKTVHIKVRDDVYNESPEITASITLDTSVPTVTITGPDVSVVSKVAGKNTCSFSFQSNVDFVAYKVKVVPATSSINTAGTEIGTTNGSTNMSASGTFTATTPIQCTVNGTDLEIASTGDGTKIVKVFVQNVAGNWSAA